MKKITFSLPVNILREGKSFVAYTPALDISTVGDTLEEVKNKFEEVVNIFFEETSSAGTLEDVLEELGWEKKKKQYYPPVVVDHTIKSFSIPFPV
ncbi:MAG: type II toxin-antitoxin system HicB family antitoxin [Patescibacteria group bacterium]